MACASAQSLRYYPSFSVGLEGTLSAVQKNQLISYREAKDLLEEFSTCYGHLFCSLEDFEPFPQEKRIPYFFDRRTYFFFYGDYERPYELLKQFEELYLSSIHEETLSEIALLKEAFLVSLEFQTRLLKSIEEYKHCSTTSHGIYVPDEEWFNHLSPLLIASPHDLSRLSHIPLLSLSCISNMHSILNQYFDNSPFTSFLVQSGPTHFFLLPQLHLRTLFTLAHHIIINSAKKEIIHSRLFDGLQRRLYRNCLQYFWKPFLVDKFILKSSGKNLNTCIDTTAQVDTNKLLLFKAIKHSFDHDVSPSFETILAELRNTVDLIKKEKKVLLRQYETDKWCELPTDDLEIWLLLIYELPFIDGVFSLPHISEDENIVILGMKDLKAIFELLPSPMSFIRLLKNDRVFLRRSHVINLDFMDRVIYYVQNGESYLRSGTPVSNALIVPHQWSTYYNEYLFEKYQDNIYEIVERYYPNAFMIPNGGLS